MEKTCPICNDTKHITEVFLNNKGEWVDKEVACECTLKDPSSSVC